MKYNVLQLFCAAFILVSSGLAQAAENYNLALGGTATQSSNYNATFALAPAAIDGDQDGAYYNGSVQSTKLNSQAWWQVDLGEVKFIDTINTWNRTDCCQNRATNFHVFVSDVPFTGTTVAASQAQAGVSDYHFTGQMGRPTPFTIGRTGRYVRVQLSGTNYLHMAEVEVFGDDPVSQLSVSKTADKTLNVAKGETITYTYLVSNTGNMPVSNINLTDTHNASDPAPDPRGEQLTTDAGLSGDSTDATPNNGIWDVLGPGDAVTFTGTYVVTQSDIDNLQ